MSNFNFAKLSNASRFVAFASGEGLRLEECRSAAGEPSALAITQSSAAPNSAAQNAERTKPRWLRKSVQWATAGSLGLVVALAAASPVHAQSAGAPDATPGDQAAAAPASGEYASVLAAAKTQWAWAHDHGFYKAEYLPKIADLGYHEAPGAGEGPAEALQSVTRPSFMHPMRLVANIQVSPTAASLGLSSDIPEIQMQHIILHEGYHAEAFMMPELTQFRSSLLHGDAADLMKGVVWAQSVLSYANKDIAANHPADFESMKKFSGSNPSAMYEESAADSFAYIVLSHEISKEDWNARLLRLESVRAYEMLSGDPSADPHETQESLQILAAIGHDRLAALTPEQSRALADAVAADGVVLAAEKQGWLSQVVELAPVASNALGWGKDMSEANKFMSERLFSALKPSAERLSHFSAAQRQAAAQGLAKEAGAWETGAQLDYGFIAEGLSAKLSARPAGAGYEKPASQTDYAAQAIKSRASLEEVRQTAMSLGEVDSSKLAGDKIIDWMSQEIPAPERAKMEQDAFWAPALSGFEGRLAKLRSQQAVASAAAPSAGGDKPRM